MSTESDGQGRTDLLIAMYSQLNEEISRHTVGVWQSIGTLLAAFGALALTEKNVISPEVATGLIVITLIWFLAQVVDSNYWYNRNLLIIANIERQLLRVSDLRDVHFYFGEHRNNSMLTHLKIQVWFGGALMVLVLVYYFVERIVPCFFEPVWLKVFGVRMVPYLVALFGAFLIRELFLYRKRSYNDILKNSPGKEMDTTAVSYGGSGHPVLTKNS